MKQLKTLVKFHKNELDQKRKALGELLSKETEITEMIAHLERELVEEQDVATQDFTVSYNYESYASSNVQRREILATILEELRIDIDKAEEETLEAYRELKKYEVTLDRRIEEEMKELERKEQILADERASTTWQRKKKNI